MGQKLNSKLICSTITKLLVSFIIVLVVAFYWNVSISNLSRYDLGTSVDIVGITGIDNSSDTWITTNEDPSITVDYEPGNVLVLDIDFIGADEKKGMIYYADVPANFSESNTMTYVYKSGENEIVINDGYAEYLRLDTTSSANVSFKINSIHKDSVVLHFLKSANYVVLIAIAVMLVALYELVRYAKTKEEKISKVFWLIMGLAILCVFGEFITGDSYYMYTGVGADTINQYYPYYVNEVNSIREGTFSIWNWNYGLGTSLLNNVAWTFDPFGILIVLLGVAFGPGSVQYLMVWMQIVKIIVLFALGKKYFSYILNNELAINISAFVLSFNGYIMLWGQHYFLGTSCVFAMLLLCAIEHFLHNDCKKGGWVVALSVAWILLFSYYVGYMILFACAVYFLFRYFVYRRADSLKGVLCDLGSCLWAVVSGLLTAGVIFIPACYYVMTNSTRLDGSDSGIIEKLWSNLIYYNHHDMYGRLSRLMSNNLLCIEDTSKSYFANYYEAPQLFCTIFIFFFFGQWIVYEFKQTLKKKSWLTLIVKLVLIFVMLFNSATGLILNAFAYASYRYTYLVFPLLGLCVGIVVQEILLKKEINLIGIIIGMLLSIVTWDYSHDTCTTEVVKYVFFVGAMLAIGAIALLIMWRKNKLYDKAVVTFLCLVIITTALDGWYSSCNRNVITDDNYSLEWEDKELDGSTATAIEWIEDRDDSLYRIGKTYAQWNELGDSLIEGYSSIVWYNSTLNSNVSEFYEEIYKNSNTSFYAIKLLRLETELDQRANDIVNTKYLLSKSFLDDEDWKLLHTVDDVYIYSNNNSDSVAKWYTDSITKKDFELLQDEEKARVLENAVVLDNDETMIQGSSAAIIDEFSLEKPTLLEGEVECEGEGILMIAVPDQEGWELCVDGEPVESINCNYGFKGVKLVQGNYKISLEYSLPYGGIGFILTIIGAIMTIIMICRDRKASNNICEELKEV